jgi:hypothetical protein
MSTAEPPTTTSWYPDRSTRLLVLGVFQVSLGCLSGLMALLVVAGSFLAPMAQAQRAQPLNIQAMIPAMVLYLLLAVVFIWLGIGLACARRWAWTLTVVVSWIWLIMGVAAIIMFASFARPMMRAMIAQQGKMPPEAIIAMELFAGGFVACAYILLPGIFLVCCHNESVRATCQRRDPKARWTDRCPMPVLALSIMFTFSAISMLFVLLPGYGPVMPLFGVFLTGAAGAAVIVLIELALAYLAWGTYRLQMAAWWGTLLLGLAGGLSMVITFSRADLMAMYEKMKMPADQLEMLRKMGFAELMSQWAPWMALVSGTAWVGYLLYVRRYFVRAGEVTTINS